MIQRTIVGLPMSQLNQDLSEIPQTELRSLRTRAGDPVPRMAIFTGEEFVGVVSKNYNLVQHKNAFRPIIEGLTLLQKDYQYRLWHDKKQAQLDILTNTGFDGVRYGFRIWNSVDGQGAIRYGFKISHVKKSLELVGYRQVCSNGMIVRVPLENAQIIQQEKGENIKIMMKSFMSVMKK